MFAHEHKEKATAALVRYFEAALGEQSVDENLDMRRELAVAVDEIVAAAVSLAQARIDRAVSEQLEKGPPKHGPIKA